MASDGSGQMPASDRSESQENLTLEEFQQSFDRSGLKRRDRRELSIDCNTAVPDRT